VAITGLRPSHIELISSDAKLLIWPKLPNSASGATVDISIDGKAKGTISNLSTQELLALGALAEGPHTFQLTNIALYGVDAMGKTTKAPVPPGSCDGQFRIGPFQTYYMLGVFSPDGKDFKCQIT
jgi:hypothetical protein